MSRRRQLLILIALALVLGSWLLREPETPPLSREATGPVPPDYFLRGVEAIATDSQGKIRHRLLADSLLHYPDDSPSELEQPHFTLYQADGSRWQISAGHGRFSDDQQEILLHGAVEIEQTGVPLPMRLETESLRLLPDRHYAETADRVYLFRPGSRLEGVGMELHGEEERLILLSAVRGVHDDNP